MSLAVGKKLGVFELSGLLGVGGMGEVYRARDTKLGREVAIKVLPEEFANDRDRLARFQREARLLAALNHPNVAHIYDLLEADGQHFLVMELVEGETLADRISNGPLPLDDVLKFFGQIAEGLEAAHQQGVIHRDLKPANIKITDDGKVSVLDFGLAKATEMQRSATNDGVTSPWDDHSAGKSSVGQIVGTPAYMSPEQARGKVVDKRTDIWAFGCCLYEALTGQRSFRGETVSDTLAMILAAEPDWKELPESTPPRLRELLRRCLAKDLRSRLCDIGDARLELSEIASNPSMSPTGTALPAGVIGIHRARFVAAILGSLLLGALAGATLWNAIRPASLPDPPVKNPQPVVRSTIILPQVSAIGTSPGFGANSYITGPRFALSPDGKRLVYVGGQDEDTRLYLRRMDGLEEIHPLPGTNGARWPFFSPDGQSVGFYAHRKLKTIRIGELQPIKVCDVQNLSGASWGHNNMIYFADSISSSFVSNGGLMCVHDAAGSTPQSITDIEGDPNVIAHAWPCALADGKSVLFTVVSPLLVYNDMSVAVLSLATQKCEPVIDHASFPQYLPTGHLVFYDSGSFRAMRFDPARRKVVGRRRVPVIQSSFLPAVSENGCLVHGPLVSGEAGDGLPIARPLVWMNRDGTSDRLKISEERYRDLRLSPDEKRLAVDVRGERGGDIWIYDLERETPPIYLTRGGGNSYPVWTRDDRVVFSSWRKGKSTNVYSAPADGSPDLKQLTDFPRPTVPMSVSPDGSTLAIVQSGIPNGADIYMLPLEGGVAAEPFLATEFNESYPAFSPDGKWLAYTSDQTGERREVFVVQYQGTSMSAPHQISRHGGSKPLWSKKEGEFVLFYRNGPQLYSVKIETEPAFKAEIPQVLLNKRFADLPFCRGYDVSADGERFLFMELTEAEAAQGPIDQLTIVDNWFEELERLLPPESAGEK